MHGPAAQTLRVCLRSSCRKDRRSSTERVLSRHPPEETALPQKTIVAKVMNLNTGKLMFSKLQTGVSPVYEERSSYSSRVVSQCSRHPYTCISIHRNTGSEQTRSSITSQRKSWRRFPECHGNLSDVSPLAMGKTGEHFTVLVPIQTCVYIN